MRPLAPLVAQGQIEHLVEIAVIEIAAVIDRDQGAAHDALEIGIKMGVLEQRQIIVERALREQHRSEALDRHIGERVEIIEDNTVLLTQHAPVIGFRHAGGGDADHHP